MVGGPNRKQKSDYFKDWENLEAELRFYLQDREKGPPPGEREREPKKPTKNPFLEFLSIDPAIGQRLDPNDFQSEDWEGEPEILSYTELTRYGYRYLMEPIIEQGGYTVVSNRLGIAVKPRRLRPRKYGRGDQPVIPTAEIGGFLALGSSLDERMAAAALIDAKKIKQAKEIDVFERQAAMARGEEQPSAAAKTPLRVVSREPEPDPVYRVAKAQDQWDEEEVAVKPRESVTLSAVQRLYVVAVAALTAVAFGKSTAESPGLGLPESALEAAQLASSFLLVANLFSMGISGVLASRQQRSLPLWVLKSAAAGLSSIAELRSLPQLSTAGGDTPNTDPTGAEET